MPKPNTSFRPYSIPLDPLYKYPVKSRLHLWLARFALGVFVCTAPLFVGLVFLDFPLLYWVLAFLSLAAALMTSAVIHIVCFTYSRGFTVESWLTLGFERRVLVGRRRYRTVEEIDGDIETDAVEGNRLENELEAAQSFWTPVVTRAVVAAVGTIALALLNHHPFDPSMTKLSLAGVVLLALCAFLVLNFRSAFVDAYRANQRILRATRERFLKNRNASLLDAF